MNEQITASRGDPLRWKLGLYSLAMSLAVTCLLVPYHWLRRFKGCEDHQALSQLLGAPPVELPQSLDLIIHAVSAGEMVAAGAIIHQLQSLRPDLRIWLTTGNAVGFDMARTLRAELPCIRGVSWLPWDRWGAINGWVKQLSPQALIVVETELWPNLFNACRHHGVALALVNGRLYPRDLWKYRLIRGFMSQVLGCPRWLGLQDEEERHRFLDIGADPRRITILGNAKSAMRPLSVRAPVLAWEANGHPPRLIVAGSTHPPEEAWLMDLLPGLRDAFPGTCLVLAPRHVHHAARLTKYAQSAGLRCSRLSLDNWQREAWDVLILDRMGELASFYSGAEVVVMGGSLGNFGGHNFLEPAWFARPILVGPHLDHFANLAERFLSQDALYLARDREEIPLRLTELLGNPVMASDLGRKAYECAVKEGEGAGGYGQAILGLLNGRSVLPHENL